MNATPAATIEDTSTRSSGFTSRLESQIRDLVRGNSVADSIPSMEPGSSHIADLIEGCAAASVRELDKLVTEMTAARDSLRAEADRLKGELLTYVNATNTVATSVKTISGNLDQWRQTAAG